MLLGLEYRSINTRTGVMNAGVTSKCNVKKLLSDRSDETEVSQKTSGGNGRSGMVWVLGLWLWSYLPGTRRVQCRQDSESNRKKRNETKERKRKI